MTLLINDPTLRDMFRAESIEHAQNIETGLISLERSPESTPLLDEVFREAHSLKGAARMLGLRDIQTLAHEIENLLDDARQGKLRITTAEVAPQLQKLDRIRALVAAAVGDPVAATAQESTQQQSVVSTEIGQPSSVPTDTLAPPLQSSAQETSKSDFAAASASSETNSSPPQPALGAASGPAEFRIDTLRVESSRLDAVFRLSAELLVSKGHIAGWRKTLEELIHDFTLQSANAVQSPDWANRLRLGLDDLRSRVNADLARFESIVAELESGIRSLRLVPVSALLDQFPRMVHDLANETGKQIVFRVEGASTVADKRIIEELKSPMMHLLRNAIDHGIESPQQRIAAGKSPHGLIEVTATQAPDAIVVRVRDDGRGIDLAAIRRQALKHRLVSEEELASMHDDDVRALILRPGFSTSRVVTDVSGRGVGLDVVRASVERLRGSLSIESIPDQGTTMRLRLPVSLTAARAVLVQEWGQTYAIPAEDIAAVRRIKSDELYIVEGRPCFDHEAQAVTPERLGHLLERGSGPVASNDELQCVLLRADSGLLALSVDQVVGIEEIVIKPNAEPLARVRNVAGFAILSTGQVCVVLNPFDLQRSMGLIGRQAVRPDAAPGTNAPKRKQRILLAEDSMTTRTQERRILEAAGYEVETAVDGLDAWNKLSRAMFDAVVSDVNMPRMSGLELTAKIRADRTHAELPVVLVTSLASEADRRGGLDAGADAYITKPGFDQTVLLDSLARLI